jgi:hypothetical protein
MELPSAIPSNAQYELNVACRFSDGTEAAALQWTLTSKDPAWCRLSLSPTTPFASATTSVTGTGSKKVYVIAQNNTAVNPRSTVIYRQGVQTDVATNVTQWDDIGSLTDNEGFGTIPTDIITYVGAFWRANQIGERVIKIDMGSNGNNLGDWTATVVWMDPRWTGNDRVVLALGESNDPNIYKATPGNAENYRVQGYNTSVSGKVISKNPWESHIRFRIGLTSTYTPTAQYPARYAIVLLSYANNTKQYKIFLRQGEDADYLFMPSDPVSGAGITSRSKAQMFTTCNLTAGTLDARADKAGTTGSNPAVFADYPTQAGAFFQWANETAGTLKGGMRWAYAPHVNGTYNANFTFTTTRLWSAIGADNEVSPKGYRRPTDGITNGNEACTNAANSEFRQSLFRNPKTGYNNLGDISNSVYGYYADGFFDRREIKPSPTGTYYTAVAVGTRDIAYVGRLFFNVIPGSDRYNASLFFPSAGSLDSRDGKLLTCGVEGTYWSSSKSDAYGLALIVRKIGTQNSACMWRADVTEGFSLRSVKIQP